MSKTSVDRQSAHERDKANRAYFVVLAKTRGSVSLLPLMAFVTAALLAVVWPWIWSIVFYTGMPELLPLYRANIVLICFSAVMCVAFMFKSWLYRFQVLASSFSVLFGVIGWVYALSLLSLTIATMETDYFGVVEFSPRRVAFAGVAGVLYLCGATVVHAFALRRRLRKGHSQKRLLGNFIAASGSARRRNFWITAGVIVVGTPVLLSGGELAMVTFGGLLFLLCATFSPSIPIEFAYLTYLKSRDKTYWEVQPRKQTRAQKKSSWKKAVMWALIVIAFIAGLVALS